MRSYIYSFAVAAALLAAPSFGAQTETKPVAKPEAKPEARREARPRAKAPVVKALLQCKIGPYEKQTRFAMETANGKPVYMAYWSSNGPYRCSFEAAPGDGKSRWLDSSVGTVVSLLSGTLLIEDDKTHFTITAREIDRMPYCGTFGQISGVLTVPKNKKDCTWEEKSSEEAGQLN